MGLYLHCAGWNWKKDAKTENALFTGEAFPTAWGSEGLKTSGKPSHFIWVNDTDKIEHPVRCVLPLQGHDSQSIKDRVAETLKSVSLELIPQPDPPQKPIPATPPVEVPEVIEDI